VDHGIETKDQRIVNGKRPNGTINLEMHQNAGKGTYTLSVYDDGQGLNLKRIKEKAIADKLLHGSDLEDKNKLADLIFRSGLSTAQTVSMISGRGVGMDVVKSTLEGNGCKVSLSLSPVSPPQKEGFCPFKINILIPSIHLFKNKI
jgi:chemotaxis protein histidine kinase CheA